jgi:hypothetical protein
MDNTISARRARIRLRTAGAKIEKSLDWLGLAYSHPLIPEGRCGVICYYDENRDSVFLPELESHLQKLKYVDE